MGVCVYSQKKTPCLKKNKIDEVIVVGYGKSTKSRMTDNVAKISAESIKEVPNANFQNALVGKAAVVYKLAKPTANWKPGSMLTSVDRQV